MKKLFTNLTFWVLLAITAGILVGHFAPEFAKYQVLDKPFKTLFLGQEIKFGTTLSEFLGDCFIDIVKQFINPIIFLTITLGIVSMGNLKKVGRVGGKALLYFEIVTTFALLAGVVVALIIQPGNRCRYYICQKGGYFKIYQRGKSFNLWQFLLHNSTLLVLIVAIIAGIALNYYTEKRSCHFFFKKNIKVCFHRFA